MGLQGNLDTDSKGRWLCEDGEKKIGVMLPQEKKAWNNQAEEQGRISS